MTAGFLSENLANRSEKVNGYVYVSKYHFSLKNEDIFIVIPSCALIFTRPRGPGRATAGIVSYPI